MPELTLRDGMVIVGSLLILAVMIDAWRRMRQQRSEVRMKIATSGVDDGSPLDDISSFRELPNGGARVVRRDVNAESSQGAEDPDGDETPAVATSIPEPAPEPEVAETESAAPQQSKYEPETASPTPAKPAPEVDDEEEALVTMRATDEPVTLDWLEDLPAHDSESADDDAGELPRDNEKVLVLHVMARSEQGFAGKDILEILLACDLRFGDMDFFHRHELEAGRGPIQFSVANMLQPGVFDIDNMDAMHTRGLLFFLTLPGPENMIQAYDYMLETARAVARNLGGEVLDESRSVLTQQSIEHSRQQIRELERRLLAQGA